MLPLSQHATHAKEKRTSTQTHTSCLRLLKLCLAPTESVTVKFSLKQLASYLRMVKNDSGDECFRLNNEAEWKAHRGGEPGYGLELKFERSFKLMLEMSWFLHRVQYSSIFKNPPPPPQKKDKADRWCFSFLPFFWEVSACLLLPVNHWRDTTLESARGV